MGSTGENLPSWAYFIFYFLYFSSIAFSITRIVMNRKNIKKLMFYILNLIYGIFLPILIFYNSLYMTGTELNHFKNEMISGEMWTYIVLSYIILNLFLSIKTLYLKNHSLGYIAIILTIIALIFVSLNLYSDNNEVVLVEKEGEVPGELLLTFSNLLQSPSDIIHISNGQFKDHLSLAAKGINSPNIDSEGDIWLSSGSTSMMYKISPTNMDNYEKKEVKGNQNFFKIIDDIKMYSSPDFENIEYNYFTVESKNKELFHKKLEGFIRTATQDNQYYYVFADIVAEGVSRVYILEKEKGNIIESIQIKDYYDAADDMVIFEDKLLLSTKPKVLVINLEDLSLSSLTPDLNSALEPGQFYVQDNKLLITYRNKNTMGDVTITEWNNNLKFLKTINLENEFHFSLYFHDNYLYIFRPSDNEKYGGYIRVYSLKDWQNIGQIAFGNREFSYSGMIVY